jgi:hypothetical protein
MTRPTKAERAEQVADATRILRAAMRRKTHIAVTITYHSGMGTRRYRVAVGQADGSVASISRVVALACGFRLRESRIDGCGEIVLWGGGYSGEDTIRAEVSRVIGRSVKVGA